MQDIVRDFTTDALDWRPHIAPVELSSATPEQLDAMKVTPSHIGVSPYVRVLAHEPDMLRERTPLFNEIMYGAGGLSRRGRELGALAASVVNHCIFCASVHAARYIQQQGDPAAVAEIFASGAKADLPPEEQALFDFAVELTADPMSVTGYHLYHLRNLGLDDLEIADLIHAVAIFGWANRLMHTLGEPCRKGGPGAP